MSQLELFDSGIGNGESGVGFSRSIPDSRPPTPDSRFPDRLYAAGLPATIPVELHVNRRVLVSRTSRGTLRVHAGYAAAPDDVVAAIARWARPKLRRRDRLAAQRILAAFPVHHYASRPAGPPARPSAGDERIFARLHELHEAFNRQHFGNRLGRIRMALSSRMRRRLGEFRLSATGLHEIVIARRHLRRDGWQGVAETLLHEMVHQWQAESGRRLDHGREFRGLWMKVVGGGGVPADRALATTRKAAWERPGFLPSLREHHC